jgi:hypothetical protein
MHTTLELKSVPDPLPGFPHHRTAVSFRVYQDFCARHRLELHDFPLARAQKWPEHPNMAELHMRVSMLRPQIHQLFDIKVLERNEFFIGAKKRFDGIGRTRADSLAVQFGTFSGHGAG